MFASQLVPRGGRVVVQGKAGRTGGKCVSIGGRLMEDADLGAAVAGIDQQESHGVAAGERRHHIRF
jgi:hypothetical protein